MSYNKSLLIVCALFFSLIGCIPSNTFEKNETIHKHKWRTKDVKSFQFDISDTSSSYLVFVTMRHSDAYNWSNIWLDVETVKPDGTASKQKVELPLAEERGRWTGRGMNEIYEHKIRLSGNTSTKFNQKGTYIVKLKQIMRENPLKEILSIGVRLERIPSSQ